MHGGDRAEQIAELGRQFVEYLHHQTGIEIIETGAVDDVSSPSALLTAFKRLDAALEQICDLASVYADDPRTVLEPLTVPTAALAGEYLRIALGANWREPNDDPAEAGDELIIVVPGGIAIDLLGVARAAIFSGRPHLTAVAERLRPNPPR